MNPLTLALDMIFTATDWPLSSPFFPLAQQVWPKWPRPTSFPSSNFAPKFFPYPKLLSRDLSPSPPSPCSSGMGPSFGFAVFPCRRRSAAMIGFAGEGGGRGHRNFLPGVFAGDGATPGGRGLVKGLVEKEFAGVYLPGVVASLTPDTEFPAGCVAGDGARLLGSLVPWSAGTVSLLTAMFLLQQWPIAAYVVVTGRWSAQVKGSDKREETSPEKLRRQTHTTVERERERMEVKVEEGK